MLYWTQLFFINSRRVGAVKYPTLSDKKGFDRLKGEMISFSINEVSISGDVVFVAAAIKQPFRSSAAIRMNLLPTLDLKKKPSKSVG